ncbi:hypothetical protein ScalyP_jg5977 [Parmales sp. scaly parma]|nr:hypothetical protein ScalyP_jg5977 [Parmales sp. scaly parma]
MLCLTSCLILALTTSSSVLKVNYNGLPQKLIYDGHGALSAGASSRLLFDYEEPYRSQILDYLFLPKFGASLHMIKVEIGGDSQSTDGIEGSHMHNRDDLDCNRGYEWWLLEEARARNPKIVTSVLSWAVPLWVGNDNFYSQDNIDYQIKWLECSKLHHSIGNIDYIGLWNERSWENSTDYVKNLRSSMDAAGFKQTFIILPDSFGGYDDTLTPFLDEDAEFRSALKGGGVGTHYPCDDPHPEVQQEYGLKYVSSEDWSTVSDWAGAGCWGRILSQNFVRMKMTSTIAWSLIWSVYEDFPYFGNGLMYAMKPWSGFYEVNDAIWTSAHHTQFSEVGWEFVDNGSGYLSEGGSYVSMVDPKTNDFSIIIEKLHGDCLRCPGPGSTEGEVVTIKLSAKLARNLVVGTLSAWRTTSKTSFAQLQDGEVQIQIHDATITLEIEPDTITTLSTTTGAQKGSFDSAPIPPDSPFSLPYKSDFEEFYNRSVPKYFADNGGSFELAPSSSSGGQVLFQAVLDPPVNNAWVPDCEPITVIGENSTLWNEKVAVRALVKVWGRGSDNAKGGKEYGGVCLHVKFQDDADGQNGLTMQRGHCLRVGAGGESWEITQWDRVLLSGGNDSGSGREDGFDELELRFKEGNLVGLVGGEEVGQVMIEPDDEKARGGKAALVSGWNHAEFDDFSVMTI